MTTETDGTEMDMSMNVEDAALSLPDHQFKVPTSAAETQNELGSTFQSYDLSRNLLEQQLFAAVLESVDSQQPSPDDATARIVDLESVLCGLKMTNDEFFPSKVYVRDCMKTILGYFNKDRLTKNSNRVLLGSPGVGKSVLFFIAALEKALNGDKPVVYMRKTKEEHEVSIFVMVRVSNGLRVFSCREIGKEEYYNTEGLANMRTKVAALFGLGGKRDCVLFLDGPRHDDEKDMEADYDYFCTSGGHPLPKNAQKKLYMWILDAWSKAEAIAAFRLLGKTEEQATEAYTVCGGCIRDMLAYANADVRTQSMITMGVKNLVGRVKDDQVELVMTSSSRDNDDDSGNPDRIRSMFNGDSPVPDMSPSPIQIVDSAKVMSCLRGRLKLESYHKALKLGKEISSGTVVGVFFEEILHQWFDESPPTGVNGVCRQKEGTTGAQGVLELDKEGLYWMPSIPNFANIDAAVILARVLYVFQYTKRQNHGFDEDSFWQDFVSVVRGKVPFDRVHVYVVVMKDVSSSLTVNFKRDWTPEGPTSTRSTAKRIEISCTSSTVSIDVTSPTTVRNSAAAAWN